MCAYLAVGVWHHWLLRRDLAFVERMWPVVRRALDFVVGMQLPFGGIAWSQEWDAHGPGAGQPRGAPGRVVEHLPVAAGRRRARRADGRAAAGVGARRRPARSRAARAPRPVPGQVARSRWTGTTRCSAARCAARPVIDLLDSRWDEFVVPGLGIRCVDTNPWVTGAETCELVMALDCLGDHERALRLFADMQHLRARGRRLLDRLRPPRGRLLAGRADDVHGGRRDPRGRRAVPHHGRVGDHARRDPGRRTSARSTSSAAASTTPQPTSSPAVPDAAGQHPHRPDRLRRRRTRRRRPLAATRGTAAGRRPRAARTRRGSPARRRAAPSGRSLRSRSARAPRRARRR